LAVAVELWDSALLVLTAAGELGPAAALKPIKRLFFKLAII
jgi:hypothetical protein